MGTAILARMVECANKTVTLTIESEAATSNAFDFRPYRGANLQFPEMTQTEVKFTTSSTLAGTYTTQEDGDGNDVTIVISGEESIPLPEELFAANYIKLVTTGNELAERSIIVTLKG